jgi:hypothetical protein
MWKWAFALALVGLGGALGADDRPAKAELPKGQATFEGVVKAVDIKANTITITEYAQGKKRDVVVRLVPGAKVAVDGKVARLEDVPIGAPHARVNGGKLEASQVTDAEGLWVTGTDEAGFFKKVNDGVLTYKPAGPPENKPPDKHMRLAPDVEAWVGGKLGSFGSFKPGDRINIRYTADGKTRARRFQEERAQVRSARARCIASPVASGFCRMTMALVGNSRASLRVPPVYLPTPDRFCV